MKLGVGSGGAGVIKLSSELIDNLPVLENRVCPSFADELEVNPVLTSFGSGPETMTSTICSMFWNSSRLLRCN